VPGGYLSIDDNAVDAVALGRLDEGRARAWGSRRNSAARMPASRAAIMKLSSIIGTESGHSPAIAARMRSYPVKTASELHYVRYPAGLTPSSRSDTLEG